MTTDFGARVLQARIQRRMALSEAAQGSGVPRSTIQAIEAGIREPKLSTALKLAAFFRIDLRKVEVLS